ncbi:MAG: hypothetical protein JAY67_15910 [Candidatus Thiodiazotropha taylori]|nr:hypothetical protein [Candidatus Thiodiazotropha taylori]
MQYRTYLLGFLSLIGLQITSSSQAAVTVYCCDATAEAQFIQDLSSLPSISTDLTKESFESSDWDTSRTSSLNPPTSVASQGITWAGVSSGSTFMRTSTAGGDVHEGSYLMFPVDERDNHLIPDKYSLTANSTTLYGVGGWFRSSNGAKIGFTSNGSGAIDFTGSQARVFEWTFLGFIDDAGFTTLQIEAVDEVGDEGNIFFSDDFTLAAASGAFPGQKLQFSSAAYSVSEGGGTVQVTVERTGGTSGAISVDYEIDFDNSTATEDQDYTSVAGTLNFAAGETTQQFSISILEDAVIEGDETVALVLSGLTVGVLNSATLTITDNDQLAVGQAQFSSNSYTFSEGEGAVSITVQRDGGSSGSGSVDYAMSDGTATAGSDYTAASGTLSFTDGQISSSITLDITEDANQEGTENLLITLSNPVGVTLGTREVAEITITDNEIAPTAGNLQFSGSNYTASEQNNEIQVPVTRINGSSGAVSVVCSTADLTAASGTDYSATQSTLSFADGEMINHCVVPILNDSGYETDETFTVSLSSVSGGAIIGSPETAVVTLSSDDPVPAAGSLQFSLSEYQQTEGGGTATISVSRSGGSSGAVSVDYASADGTATAGSDYVAVSGTLSLADGVSSGAFQVTLSDDTSYEGDETLSLMLSNPTGGAVLGSNTTAGLTISEDDEIPLSGLLVFSAAQFGAEEFDGIVEITVERQGGSSGSVQVNYSTSDGTAVAGSDYEVASGSLTFADGELSKTVEVTIIDDSLLEGSESFNISLSDAVGTILGDVTTATVVIGDDDEPPAAGAITFSNAAFSATEDSGDVTINVDRIDGSTGAVSVNYYTSDGTAVASSDYTFTAGSIDFADGDNSTKSFTVALLNDSDVETDETVSLQLSNFQGGAVAGSESSAQIIITDDDAQSSSSVIGFTITSLTVNESSVNASFTIDRSVVLTGTVSVDLSIGTSTAVAGTDFNVTTGTLEFASGESQKTIDVEIIDNTIVDGDLTIIFVLGNVSGTATIDSNSRSFTLTIADDESDGGSGDDNGGGGGGGSADIMLLLGLMIIVLSHLRLHHLRRVRVIVQQRGN